MERQPISREGYEKLREDIRQLEDVDMPKIAQAIAEDVHFMSSDPNISRYDISHLSC